MEGSDDVIGDAFYCFFCLKVEKAFLRQESRPNGNLEIIPDASLSVPPSLI